MVYINMFNAFFFLLIDVVLAGFIIFAGYLWIQKLQSDASISISGEVTSHQCNCLSITDGGGEIIVMNAKCSSVTGLTVNEISYSAQLYKGDYVVYYYNNISLFNFAYNTCSEYYTR
ncbi:Uncharacterised protein [Candidatus Tiddalikarchaeum anstoanum]|nr:Uncharacterised protein [Candidatus Tiddalikarchaeum anstoanum]